MSGFFLGSWKANHSVWSDAGEDFEGDSDCVGRDVLYSIAVEDDEDCLHVRKP